MQPHILLYQATCICFFLLAFIALFNPSKVNVAANRWLGVFFVSVGCMLINAILFDDGIARFYPKVIAFNELSRFAMAPALYLSIVQFTTPGGRIGKMDYLHLIPFAIFFMATAPVVFIPGHYIAHFPAGTPPIIPYIIAALVVITARGQLLVYWALAYYKLYQHRKNIQLVASNTAPVNLSWLKYLLISIGVMLVQLYALLLFNIHLPAVYTPLIYLLGTLAVLYYSLAQKEVYPFEPSELTAINEVIETVDEPVRSIKQRLPDEQARTLQVQLELLMRDDRLYLDNELSLPQLAGAMGITVHDLSYLLNDHIGINFFRFVNSYRVEEAKRIMLSDKYKHLNILGVAYSAGFSSKTTFNTAFKKQTGMAPGQFIRQAKTGATPVVSYQS